MKKLFTILALLMAFMVNGFAEKTVYLKPNSDWLSNEARFALYMYNETGNSWTDFSAVESAEGYYKATVPATYENGSIICVRMNGATTENNWDNKWNQTSNINPINDKAIYVITGWDTYTESVVPTLSGTELWSSSDPVYVNWNGNITVPAEKFATAKVGDIIHVAVEGVTAGSAWDAQVSLRDGSWGEVEGDVPVGTGTVTDASFVITGDLLKIFKEKGILISGKNFVSRLVTIESGDGSYSDESIWIGEKTSSFTIDANHFKNSEIKAGNVIRVTATAISGHEGDIWMVLSYDKDGWKEYGLNSYKVNSGFEFLVTEDVLETMKTYGVIINQSGYTVTQVEIITESAVDQIVSVQLRGGWNGWDAETSKLTRDADSFTWTGEIDLANNFGEKEFKFVLETSNSTDVNWYGCGQIDLADDGTASLLTIGDKYSNFILNNTTSKYTATLTWEESSCAYVGWTLSLKADGVEYYTIKGNNETWSVGEKMTENEGVYTSTISDWAGNYFAIAPKNALYAEGVSESGWSKVIRPVVSDETKDFLVEFFNYSDATTTPTTGGKVWKIDASNTADVTINFTPAENKFEITNAEEFTIGQYGYSTYSRAQKYQVEGATVSFVTVSGSKATLVAVDAEKVLPAMEGAGKHAGVIIAGEAGAKAIIKSVYADAEAVDASANLLAGTGDNSYEVGTQFADGDTYTAYILAKPDGKDLGFYLLDDTERTLAAHKAFLAVPGESQAPFFGFGGDDTTGINSVERGALSVEGCYTLDGRRVEQPTKGLYIINGKKVLVK